MFYLPRKCLIVILFCGLFFNFQNHTSAQKILVDYYSPVFSYNESDSLNINSYQLLTDAKISEFVILGKDRTGSFDESQMKVSFSFDRKNNWFLTDFIEKTLIAYQTSSGQQYYFVKEKTPKINWEITNESKKIGGYETIKATAFFRGRNYEVWFAPSVPIAAGPWKLQGLPGLILEARDLTNTVVFLFKGIQIEDATKKLIAESENCKDCKFISPEEFYRKGKKDMEAYFKYVENKLQRTNADINISINKFNTWEIFEN